MIWIFYSQNVLPVVISVILPEMIYRNCIYLFTYRLHFLRWTWKFLLLFRIRMSWKHVAVKLLPKTSSILRNTNSYFSMSSYWVLPLGDKRYSNIQYYHYFFLPKRDLNYRCELFRYFLFYFRCSTKNENNSLCSSY